MTITHAWKLGLALLTLAAAAPAQQAGVMTHTANPTLAAWSDRLTVELGRQLVYPPPPSSTGIADEGVAAIKFNCSEKGAPANVALLKSSGYRRLDVAAMRAVSRVQTLHPLPVRLKNDQQFVALIIFARDDQALARQMLDVRREMRTRNSWYDRIDRTAVVIGGPAPLRG